MRIVIAPDSFKESMDAKTAARSIAEGIHRADPAIECVEIPVADGGEGLVSVLTDALGGVEVSLPVTGPLGQPVIATYGWVSATKTAIIEVAEACGIHLVAPEDRRIFDATSYGVGELLEDTRKRGAHTIIVGLGGSVTNDGGSGAAEALGARIVDSEGGALAGTPASIINAVQLDLTAVADWEGIDVVLACDVTTPLLGPRGASAVFGPQKGATPMDVPILDRILKEWCALMHEVTGVDVANLPGAGAAGGIAGALVAFIGARIESGIEVVLRETGFCDKARGADLVITGEGRIDSQTSSGKAPWGVRNAAAELGISTVALCGSRGEGAEDLVGPHGFVAVQEIVDPCVPLERALAEGPHNAARISEALVARLPELIAGGSSPDGGRVRT